MNKETKLICVTFVSGEFLVWEKKGVEQLRGHRIYGTPRDISGLPLSLLPEEVWLALKNGLITSARQTRPSDISSNVKLEDTRLQVLRWQFLRHSVAKENLLRRKRRSEFPHREVFISQEEFCKTIPTCLEFPSEFAATTTDWCETTLTISLMEVSVGLKQSLFPPPSGEGEIEAAGFSIKDAVCDLTDLWVEGGDFGGQYWATTSGYLRHDGLSCFAIFFTLVPSLLFEKEELELAPAWVLAQWENERAHWIHLYAAPIVKNHRSKTIKPPDTAWVCVGASGLEDVSITSSIKSKILRQRTPLLTADLAKHSFPASCLSFLKHIEPDISGSWEFKKSGEVWRSLIVPHRCILYENLFNRGYSFVDGRKFGGDWLAYSPGSNPQTSHSEFIVKIVPLSIAPMGIEMSALLRVAQAVKKKVLLGWVSEGSARWIILSSKQSAINVTKV